MTDKKVELKDEDLVNVNGGGVFDIPISDETITNVLGYDWASLSLVLSPFIAYAKENGYIAHAQEIENLLNNKSINITKINNYKASLNTLLPVAQAGNFTDAVEILSSLSELFG